MASVVYIVVSIVNLDRVVVVVVVIVVVVVVNVFIVVASIFPFIR